MQLIGRWIWIVFALLIAITAAVVFLPIALVSDPLLHKIGSVLAFEGVEALITMFFDPEIIAGYAGGILTIIWLVIVAICVAPVTITAVVGEAAGIRTILWYGLASAILAGAMPWIMRVSKTGSPAGTSSARDTAAQAAELRLALIFCLTGLAAGIVYWLLAGRNTGRSASSG